MKSSRILFLLLSTAGAVLAQLPTITEITNAASYTPPGVPNYGVAQGALFVVKGANLGPAAFVVANSFPLQTSIGGSSITIQIKGQTLAAIMYYAGASQLAAILPSSTPTGTGVLKVTYNGRTTNPASITVVQNAVGIFTISTSGSGDAVAYRGTTLLGASNAANPGETVFFLGTGLGPVSFDETNPAQQLDMTDVPLEAYVGGKPANILYRGRIGGCCSSVDVIYIQIPADVAGCVVPVVFAINNVVSNTTSIPIAASGRVCTPANPAYSSASLGGILSQPSFSLGSITLTHEADTSLAITSGPNTSPATTNTADSGTAAFVRVALPAGGAGVASAFDIAAYGSCLVNTSFNASGYTPPPHNYTYLDAGVNIGVSGPRGSIAMPKLISGDFVTYSATLDVNGAFLTSGGQYKVTGAGGADVGSFSAPVTLPPPLNWTNQTTTLTVDRTAGVTVNWSGGDPAGYVSITGQSVIAVNASTTVGVSFTCSARTSDGTFTVPPIVLLGLPASGNFTGTLIPGVLTVSGSSAPALFQASGLDYGSVTESAASANQVYYQ